MENAIGANRPSALYDNSPTVTKILFTVIKVRTVTVMSMTLTMMQKKLPEKFSLPSEGAAKEDCGPSQAQADASSRVQRLKLPDFGDWHSSLKNLQFTPAVETVFKVSETIWGAIQYNDKREARLRGFCASTHFRKKKKVENTILESWRKIVFSKYIQSFHFLQLVCLSHAQKMKSN